MKTKPTQHSVKELREIGIQPDVVLCRADRPLPEDDRRKIALFTNVRRGGDLRRCDADSIYKIPAMLHAAGARRDRLPASSDPRAPPADLSAWSKLVDALEHPEHEVDIAMVGKYVDLHRVVQVAVRGADATPASTRARKRQHPLRRLRGRSSATASTRSKDMDAILVPGGFGKRGVEGKIAAIRYARENGIPYLGICLGMQLAVIEFARHVARPRRREQHRVRSRHAASGGRAHHRMAEPRRHASRGATRSPTSAARCASARSRARSSPARSRTRSTARRRSPSATGTATK